MQKTDSQSAGASRVAPTGADAIVAALFNHDVSVCFANPGTSEMPFVAAAGAKDDFLTVLCLFEGVATGAADGYGRMADKPAATLLHVGSGLSNGVSQLHNAAKARTPVVNIVGDHATDHIANRDHCGAWMNLDRVASTVSDRVVRVSEPSDLINDVATAVTAARAAPGHVATLAVPSDILWSEEAPGMARAVSAEPVFSADFDPRALASALSALESGDPVALLLSARATRTVPLDIAGRICAATGAKLFVPSLNARIERGGDRVPVTRVPYPVDAALTLYRDIRHVIIIGAPDPLVNFAYPGKPLKLTPEGCDLIHLAGPGDDPVASLGALAETVGAPTLAKTPYARPNVSAPSGPLDEEAIATALLKHLPDDAIVIDESITSGRTLFAALENGPRHDWLQNVGGAIGMAMPMGIGAAMACPDRRVLCLEGDGSAMYSIQALWTQAREILPVTTLLFSNRAYGILRIEARNVGADVAATDASGLVQLDNPSIDWVPLAKSLGVEAVAVSTAEALADALQTAFAHTGPYFIEVQLP